MKKPATRTARKSPAKPATRRPVRGKPHSATTADILGVGVRTQATPARRPVPRRWAAQHRALLRLRADLERQMGHLSSQAMEDVPNYSEHMADAGTDSFDRDFALGLLSSEQDAVNEIDQALRRIETGSYGICELTGKPIPKSRLEAIPWTRFSLEAQRKLEREGAVSRAHLGVVREVAGSEPGEPSEEEEAEAEKSTA